MTEGKPGRAKGNGDAGSWLHTWFPRHSQARGGGAPVVATAVQPHVLLLLLLLQQEYIFFAPSQTQPVNKFLFKVL